MTLARDQLTTAAGASGIAARTLLASLAPPGSCPTAAQTAAATLALILAEPQTLTVPKFLALK